jgi:hypothetical protein
MLTQYRSRRLTDRIDREAHAIARLVEGSAHATDDIGRLESAFRETALRGISQERRNDLDRSAARFRAGLAHFLQRCSPGEDGKNTLARDVCRLAAGELTGLWQRTAS